MPTWLAPILAGVAVHGGIQLVEIDLILPHIGTALVCIGAAYVGVSVHLFNAASYVDAAVELARAAALLALGLTASMLVYRGWFHRLRRFPGPGLARFSKLYAVAVSARRVQWHRELEGWHGVYGDVVRTGPRELSIARAEAVAPLAACRKSTLYALSDWNDDRLGLIETRSLADHRQRRKPWETALSTKALAQYDPELQSTIGIFLDAIATAGEGGAKAVNVTDWIAYLAYDLMGVVGFGRDFGQLRGGGVEHWAVRALRAQQLFIGVLKPVPWLLNALSKIPGADGPVRPFMSDTTSNTLINALYYLSRHPRHWRALQASLAALFPGGPASFTYARLAAGLADVPLLDAVINETMRLKPATPGGNPRVTPPEGLRIALDDDEPLVVGGGGEQQPSRRRGEEGSPEGNREKVLVIPGNTDVHISPYVLQRSPRYFACPNDFVPERWIDDDDDDSAAQGGRPELVRDARKRGDGGASRAFFPFQVGQYACAGKALAMWEMRSVLARVALRFDLGWEEVGEGDEEGKAFDEGMRDTFTMTLGPMWLRFKERGRWWAEEGGESTG
ncbi:hypothetical protein SLS58_005406 [Diplodia intermedia]|uniref:Cytochrome P450 n=1 Tax=Diplodia intermedia TaxID=856260 RepID=A0ABR3TQV5_9PEZI